jgi:hypothetical protein
MSKQITKDGLLAVRAILKEKILSEYLTKAAPSKIDPAILLQQTNFLLNNFEPPATDGESKEKEDE